MFVALLALSSAPALAHPGKPDINFAVINAQSDCEFIRWIVQ